MTTCRQNTAAKTDVGALTPSKRRRTLRSNANGPRKGVLELPELLEIILSFLSEREIFAKAQRVSRFWKETINRSPTIQRILWLKSQVVNATEPTSHAGDAPLILPFGDPRYERRLNHDPNMPIYANEIALNHLLQPIETRREVWHIPAELRTIATMKYVVGEPFEGLMVNTCTFHLPLKLKPQTWHSMYLTEPRITVAQLKVYPSAPYKLMDIHTRVDSWTTASVRDMDGLTFGLVLDIAKKICHSVVPARARGRYQADVQVYIATKV